MDAHQREGRKRRERERDEEENQDRLRMPSKCALIKATPTFLSFLFSGHGVLRARFTARGESKKLNIIHTKAVRLSYAHSPSLALVNRAHFVD